MTTILTSLMKPWFPRLIFLPGSGEKAPTSHTSRIRWLGGGCSSPMWVVM